MFTKVYDFDVRGTRSRGKPSKCQEDVIKEAFARKDLGIDEARICLQGKCEGYSESAED